MKMDYKVIGKRIKYRRNKMHLTQEALAERCEVSAQYVSHIERAVSIPSTEVVMRLAAALDTTPDEFLVGTAKYTDEGWREVAEGLRGLTPKQLALTRSFLDWVREQEL